MVISQKTEIKFFRNAVSRWSRFGPYYAMFPFDFAVDVINRYSSPDDWIIDPFAGRATSIYASAALGRHGFGIEIFPVGWVYGKAKLSPAPIDEVITKLDVLAGNAGNYRTQAKEMPEFYQYCFSPNVLSFLLAARNELRWRENNVDTTVMAFILLYLHGKLGEGLSNQMRQTKAMYPEYSVEWWKTHNLISPPQVNYRDFLLQRIRWRYRHGAPELTRSVLILGNSTDILPSIHESIQHNKQEKFSLLFTSPPYYNVINYFNDQWLRLWVLGGEERPHGFRGQFEGKFCSKEEYIKLLNNVFGVCKNLMQDKSVVYVRTDAREFTYQTTLSVLREKFPGWNLQIIPAPVLGKTQTDLFMKMKDKVGEMDIVLTSPSATKAKVMSGAKI